MSESKTAATSTHSYPHLTYRSEENHDDVDPRNQRLAHDDKDMRHEQTPSLVSGLQGGDNEPEVLQPDHPLMKKFQVALKDHLTRQYNRLSEEILKLEAGIKNQKLECEKLGLNIYDVQQNVMRQQSVTDNYHKTIANITKIRQEIEAQVETCRNTYKSEQEKLNNAQKEEEDVRTELENLVCLEEKFADWEKQLESKLASSERISEKTKTDKKQFTKEMQKQDIFIFKLMTEVENLQGKNRNLSGLLKLKELEKNKVGQSVADTNADLETLDREQHRLMQSWSSVIISIQQRDKIYMSVMQDYNKVKQQLQTLINEIEGFKKASVEEMLKNEHLTIILKKIHSEEANLKRLIAVEEGKKGALEIQLASVHNMLEQTDKDVQEVMLVYHKNSHENKMLQKRVERLVNEKVALEDRILAKLQDQITQDKASKYLNKVLQTLRDKIRDKEIVVVNVVNQLTQTSKDLDHQKGMNEQTNIVLDDLKKQTETKEKELKSLQSDLHQSKFEVHKKQGTVDSLRKKLEQLTPKSGDEYLSPQEIKIKALEKNITKTIAKCEELQQFWLQQQTLTVKLANQRNEQVHNINLTHKQVLILDQKNLKIEHQINCQKKVNKVLNHSISSLNKKLLSLNLKLCERKEYMEILDKENLYTETYYMSVLKDAELEAVKLKSEIHDLEQEKIQLGGSLLEKQQEFLAWEKKLQIAQETKQNTQYEKGKEGDMVAMKAEIHRMQEIKSLQHQTKVAQQRHDQLIQQVKDKENELKQLEDTTRKLDVQLEEGKLQRQKNLEVLVRRQFKTRMYNDIKSGHYHLLFRSEQSLDVEMRHQKTINADLISILESLLTDFPPLMIPLTKALNTLQLKPA
ncbi:coiled-coil domain-containing protein 40 isoform X2 [Zootermopsis nevadensis]|uniref:coiled-coil domain-containing protein 40 isoform X2 n=1 Tax=Zootermopsis nevadensis TaxID=136037 RepID=UPI000B8E24BA|nr:coiled-coil domain-containing protein 40 isoform X2 [Zootermopsis nevadensis]